MTTGGARDGFRDTAHPRGWRSPALLGIVAAACGGLLATGGCSHGPTLFRCASDGECVSPDTAGVCEATGYCSFPDPSCAGTARRYGRYVGDGLAGTCVAGPEACGETDGPCCDGGLCETPLVCADERCVIPAARDAGGEGGPQRRR